MLKLKLLNFPNAFIQSNCKILWSGILVDHSKDGHPRLKKLVEIGVFKHALPCINLPEVAGCPRTLH